ncbi:hypothetical protein CEXT_737961 [Caerostris extrusa]|uniref:Uncharacterized protein n=1 Tax=Caerostris extrusa TaxID=172846 RepID=A0AAV4UD12_CAEEX|nr:hypothetical protein CEXT_737961 [Caerostris extrusa]
MDCDVILGLRTCFTASKGKRKKTNWSDEDNADSQSSINSSKNDGQSAHSTELYRKDLISTMTVVMITNLLMMKLLKLLIIGNVFGMKLCKY